MNDPQKLAALAALVGITPETHRHLLTKHCSRCDSINLEEQDTGYHSCRDCYLFLSADELVVKFTPPALDTPAGDDVFLAPVMRWLQEHDFNPSIVGLDFGHQSKFMFAADCFSMESMRRTNNFYDDTMTAALLRACQSAGVPEIVAIFGEAINE